MIESGTFRSSQYLDLISQAYPPQEDEIVAQRDLLQQSQPPTEPASVPAARPDAQQKKRQFVPMPAVSHSANTDAALPETIESDSPDRPSSSHAAPSDEANQEPEINKEPAETASGYGPMRRIRLPSKSGPLTMFRPAAMRHDDFVEVMREVVPQLIDDAIHDDDASMSAASKRPAEAPGEEPVSKASRTDEGAALVEHAIAYVEAASCSQQESQELWDTFKNTSDNAIEVFINQYFHKRAQKEVSKNEPLLQARVDQSKVAEWQTLIDKGAVRVLSAKESRWVRKHRSDRIMGSRFVIVKKPEEEIIENGGKVDPNVLEHWKIKSRWCLQGHLDPDLAEKASAGQLQSPTLSQMGRTVMFQLMASHKWQLQLGDIKGAFLEAGPLPACYRPLYASLPNGGIPGIDPECLIEILGNVYGQNDAPAAWYRVFNDEVLKSGFERSKSAFIGCERMVNSLVFWGLM
eukprot:s3508_g8.t1